MSKARTVRDDGKGTNRLDDGKTTPRVGDLAISSATQSSSSVSSDESNVRKNPYHELDYWNLRYAKVKGLFDWYTDFSCMRHVVLPLISHDSKVLNVGCGNSRFAESLATLGYGRVTSVDISDVCINRMKERYASSTDKRLREMRWIQADGADLRGFKDGEFDLVVDKGTIDALVCGEESNNATVRGIVSEAYRVLRHGGVFLCVSYGAPPTRLALFRKKSERGALSTKRPGGSRWEICVRRVSYSPSALLIRRLRAVLQGRALATATKSELAEALAGVRLDMKNVEVAEDLGPEKSTFCYAYCCCARKDAGAQDGCGLRSDARPSASSAETDPP